MALQIASWIVHLIYAYITIGVLLLPWWHLSGLKKLDATAGHGSWGFRVLISPGLIALWAWLLPRSLRGSGHPVPEKNAHRRRSLEAQR